MTEELAGRGVRVTIKYGKSYEDTWVAFSGTPREVQEDIIAFFGLDGVDVPTLDALVLKATQIAHGQSTAVRELGGVVLGSDSSQQASTDQPAANSDDPWAAAQGVQDQLAGDQQQADPNAALYSAIEAAADVDGLKRLWADNQPAFTDQALMDAWKAKGKALQGAAS